MNDLDFLTYLQITYFLRYGITPLSIFADNEKRHQLNIVENFFYMKMSTIVFIYQLIGFVLI